MLDHLRTILLLGILLLGSLSAMAQLAMPDYVCEGDLKQYHVDANPIAGSTYTWRIDGVVQGSSSNVIDIVWNTAGDYLLDVQELAVGGCPGPLRSGRVFVSPSPVAIATSNSPVCIGNAIHLYADAVLNATYEWSIAMDVLSTEQNAVIPSASYADAGNYVLVVHADGCASQPAMVTVEVNDCDKPDFFIPEGYSPNGDGVNDVFFIRGILDFPFNDIVIFNRWGNRVFEASPYLNNWDGRSMFGLVLGADELPVGTYFYLLDLNNGSPIFKGTIYLTR